MPSSKIIYTLTDEAPALATYSLLPIVRNTLTALTTVDPVLVRVATSMGLNPREQLRHLLLPLNRLLWLSVTIYKRITSQNRIASHITSNPQISSEFLDDSESLPSGL